MRQRPLLHIYLARGMSDGDRTVPFGVGGICHVRGTKVSTLIGSPQSRCMEGLLHGRLSDGIVKCIGQDQWNIPDRLDVK